MDRWSRAVSIAHMARSSPHICTLIAAVALSLAPALAWAEAPDDHAPPEPPEPAEPPELPELPDMPELADPEADAPGAPTADDITLNPLVQRLLEDELTDDARRRQLRLFHGQWDELDTDALTPDQRAQLALLQYRLDDEALADGEVDKRIRAEAALHRGEPERVNDWLDPESSARAALLYARAREDRGQLDRAVEALRPWREALAQQPETLQSAAEVTAAARGVVLLAHLEGRPAQDHQFAMNQLGRAHQQLDALHWPARLAEAEILVEKDNARDAIAALEETLALNPRSSRAWYRLGRFSAERFDFDRAEQAIDELRGINEPHLLADKLEAHLRLQQRDARGAMRAIERARQRYPDQRRLAALAVAAAALQYDDDATQAALERFDALAPGSPLAAYKAGVYLSLARQYPEATEMLRQAIVRQPNWPAPHVELGLLLMQVGDNEAAHEALRRATRLDPFNRRAGNQLTLVEALLGYETIETENFVIRYEAGIDAVLARDIALHVEDLYDEITRIFQHEPERKTQIDIMPDEEWFGVRITGMPDIWTIAAATGDVLSLTPPREGARQRGTFDWLNVLRHEYVHTVTLSQTRNRVPHWFTEAAAVAEELVGRDYETARMLAWALEEDELFDLEGINWGFVRPRRQIDRPLAYAQSHWMLEYIRDTHGNDAVIALLEAHREGVENVAAIERVLGVDDAQFMAGFREWARADVERWGLAPPPDDARVRALLESGSEAADAEELRELIEAHGEHPSLLRLLAEQALESEDRDPDAARRKVLRYAEARPVDPWAHRQLARLAVETGHRDQAIAALEALDAQEAYHGDWAHQLARLQREAGRIDAAAAAMERALHREPYNAGYRELAATLALQRGELRDARRHIEALTLLEPERAQHQLRLAAVLERLDEPEAMRRAAERARELDPDAPVERFLE